MASAAAPSLRRIAGKRFSRSLRGYDPAEVDAAISARDTRLARLERDAGRLAERLLEKERRLRSLSGDDRGAVATLIRRLEELRAEVRRQATGAGTRALRDAIGIVDRVLGGAIGEAGGRIPRPWVERGRPVAQAGGHNEPFVVRRTSGDERPGPNGSGPDVGQDGVFEGEIEVEIGPLDDFSQLSGFEDAAAEIAAADGIEIRRFSNGRATLGINLREPVELLRELERHSPLEFRVRDAREGSVVLDIDERRRS